MGSRGRRSLVGVVLVVLAAVGCGQDDRPDTEAGQAGGGEPSVDMVGIEAVEASDDHSITVRTEPVPVEVADGSCRAEVTPRADEHGGESAMIDVSVEVRADRPQLGDPATRDENGFVVTWEGCENIRRLYFRIDTATDTPTWTVAGSDPGPGCGTITTTIPDFPTHLCHDLPTLDAPAGEP
jgi:hypothetical protein